ncbi:MAG: non-heme iron oxygenase ferredoxin subunit [Gammaproteobacteria bacterium]|nr:MAG: non-heme iron oxygenase ferredoxin subunit [Gammaproteobacteria bacterium]
METPWEKVAEAGELTPGQMKRITPGGRRLLLCNADGKLYAVDEMCSHEDYSLFLGCIQEGKIKCSLHGSYFDLETGQPTVEPASEPICTYPLRVSDGEVWVNPDQPGSN